MRIVVGSRNPAKLAAVEEALRDYEMFEDCQIHPFGSVSGVPEQPHSLDEISTGAINRAQSAFASGVYNYSFGIESGLIKVPKMRKVDFAVCAIYDGTRNYLGVSCGFEIPESVDRIMREQNVDLPTACRIAELTTKEKLGNEEGLIGILTGGRVTRKDQAKQAIQMALIYLTNPDLDRSDRS